jgi:hypothetical protein
VRNGGDSLEEEWEFHQSERSIVWLMQAMKRTKKPPDKA